MNNSCQARRVFLRASLFHCVDGTELKTVLLVHLTEPMRSNRTEPTEQNQSHCFTFIVQHKVDQSTRNRTFHLQAEEAWSSFL